MASAKEGMGDRVMHCYQCKFAKQMTDDYPNTDTIYFCEEKETLVLAGYKCDDFESRVVAPQSGAEK